MEWGVHIWTCRTAEAVILGQAEVILKTTLPHNGAVYGKHREHNASRLCASERSVQLTPRYICPVRPSNDARQGHERRTQSGPFTRVPLHNQDCSRRKVRCSLGCGSEVEAQRLLHHEQEICTRACCWEGCGERVGPANRRHTHERYLCQHRPAQCAHGCGTRYHATHAVNISVMYRYIVVGFTRVLAIREQ